MRFFLCLGSNIEDRGKNLEKARTLIKEKGIKILKKSSIYETEPVDSLPQPWFYNQVIKVSAGINPIDLLTVIKQIERRMGRKLTTPREPRIIDIDILLAEKTVVQTEKLEIPHPRMERRNFVLTPFKEISPDTTHPILRTKIKDLWIKSKDRSIVKKIKK
ncbi:MAG: 2-amino-4-hydroxy-6-hydroxymethyldihydropteridine diphosphokinase [Candidatus Aminicenantes bacterium]|nr:MAG: 2-amino-4-hydroxy-6-hydroxymethyldihydropteridine diphosphokinase [Candidatus Aminicenantes bacterium]